MGDRCYLQITFRESDRETVGRIMGTFDTEDCNENETVTADQLEVNYGALREREELAMAGVPFEGYHDGCAGAYSEHCFASAGGVMVECLSLDAQPVARIKPDLTICKDDIDEVAEYYRVLGLAKEAMKPPIDPVI